MALVGTVRLGGPGVFMGSVLESLPDASLQVQYQATTDNYTFEASECDFDRLEAALSADETVADPRLLADYGSVRVYRVRPVLDRPLLSSVAGELDVQLLETESADGAWRMRIRFPDRSALAALKEYCDDNEVVLQVTRLYTETDPEDGGAPALTDAQRELLVTAYEKGYLEEPRECSLADLAAELDISSSAASGRLRRALSALVESQVVGD